MKTQFFSININTKKPLQFIDITKDVKNSVINSKIKNGLCCVYSKHTTSAIKINENEERLINDIENLLKSVVPEKSDYGHNTKTVDDRPNAHSHLRSLLLQQSETIPVENSELLLGGWQSIFFVELDGPRDNRKVIVEVLGEIDG
ncbi:secondary thiamine-phosphate synthase enzyme YjbQ [Candidatus Woesearchaeota archaeon]|nr:secondary thiamine-phosphate synthase enzyme YjbQ [Candidatus Woesearchaeota archaeon]